ncbi:MAG: ABC transporter substrate-binding protein [Cytophagales bacterium]|nr:ABC transporter substrate-binding protein [Cytophagales bacterium]
MKNYWLALLVAMAACQRNNSEQPETIARDTTGFCFRSEIQFADCFDIIPHDNYKQIIVFDVWNNKDTLSNFIIVPKNTSLPESLPDHEYVLPVPISSIVALSGTHLGFIDLLNALDCVKGVSNGRRLYNKYLYKRFAEGKIAELGTAESGDLEQILDLAPEVVMKTGFEDVRKNDKRILGAGLRIAYNIEWMETKMLGRAEWIKFVGALFCKEAEADSIFSAIRRQYQQVAGLIVDIENKPTVLSGSNYKGTWFLPGGRSYIAQLIVDAGGDYHYKNESSKGSIPLSFEVVLENLVDADIWIGPRAGSLEELRLMDERYKLFKAYKNGRVYHIDNRTTESGGNDYWESGVARPDLLLKDIVRIFHPDLIPGHKLFYYRRLEKEPSTKTSGL